MANQEEICYDKDNVCMPWHNKQQGRDDLAE